MRNAILLALLTVIAACAPKEQPAPPVSEAEVQDFVRAYVAAVNAGDATKVMSLISKDAGTTSIGYGQISRGWEDIRKVVDENNATAASSKLTVATVTVQPLSRDLAIAFAPFTITLSQGRTPIQVPGAATLLVRRTPGGLQMIHEHYSAKLGP